MPLGPIEYLKESNILSKRELSLVMAKRLGQAVLLTGILLIGMYILDSRYGMGLPIQGYGLTIDISGAIILGWGAWKEAFHAFDLRPASPNPERTSSERVSRQGATYLVFFSIGTLVLITGFIVQMIALL